MKKQLLVIFALAFCPVLAFAQSDSLEEKALISLDAQWEQAQLFADSDFLQSLLAVDFIWIHNHASTTDDKDAVIERAKKQQTSGANDTRSRTLSAVKVIILGQTAIVTGTTVVDRGPSPTTYNFMRTYVQLNGKYYLLANHTMAIPEE